MARTMPASLQQKFEGDRCKKTTSLRERRVQNRAAAKSDQGRSGRSGLTSREVDHEFAFAAAAFIREPPGGMRERRLGPVGRDRADSAGDDDERRYPTIESFGEPTGA